MFYWAFSTLFLYALLPSFVPFPLGIMDARQPLIVDNEGNVYVINGPYNVIQVFDEEGRFITRVKPNYAKFGSFVQFGPCLSIDYKGRIWFISHGVLERIIGNKSYLVPMKRVRCIPEGAPYCEEEEYDEDNFKLDGEGNLIITGPNRNPSEFYTIIKPGEYLFPACASTSTDGKPFIDRFGREWRRSLLPVPHIVVRKDGKVIRRIYGPWLLIPFTVPFPAGAIIIGTVYFAMKIYPKYCENGNKQENDESDEANTGY